MKTSYAAIAAALAGAAFILSATMVHASLDQAQMGDRVETNVALKADSSEPLASHKGDLLPIRGSFAPVTEVMLYRTAPNASTVLPLPAMVRAQS